MIELARQSPTQVSDEGRAITDALNTLLRISGHVKRFRDWLVKLSNRDQAEEILLQLCTLEDSLFESERYLREEALAQVCSGYGNQFTLPRLPEGFAIRVDEQGMELKAPLWAFGLPPAKKKPASFHRNRSYIREYVFWDALIRKIIEDTQVHTCRDGCSNVSVVMRAVPKAGVDGMVYSLGTHSFDTALSALLSHQLVKRSENGSLYLQVVWEPAGIDDEEIGVISIQCRKDC